MLIRWNFAGECVAVAIVLVVDGRNISVAMTTHTCREAATQIGYAKRCGDLEVNVAKNKWTS